MQGDTHRYAGAETSPACILTSVLLLLLLLLLCCSAYKFMRQDGMHCFMYYAQLFQADQRTWRCPDVLSYDFKLLWWPVMYRAVMCCAVPLQMTSNSTRLCEDYVSAECLAVMSGDACIQEAVSRKHRTAPNPPQGRVPTATIAIVVSLIVGRFVWLLHTWWLDKHMIRHTLSQRIKVCMPQCVGSRPPCNKLSEFCVGHCCINVEVVLTQSQRLGVHKHAPLSPAPTMPVLVLHTQRSWWRLGWQLGG
jgi:hypothetical protein